MGADAFIRDIRDIRGRCGFDPVAVGLQLSYIDNPSPQALHSPVSTIPVRCGAERQDLEASISMAILAGNSRVGLPQLASSPPLTEINRARSRARSAG